jgi:transposase
MQPDFVNQKSILEEHCEARGYHVIFFPKFHCKLNFIEQCWGYAKRIYRMFPTSSKEEDLERNMNAASFLPSLVFRGWESQ